MHELCPYFTNDGTVGLFSKNDDDIYHSTYGAVTESWQKFIIPAKLQEYVLTHDTIKILDLCYGIGYNSKAALNVFVDNFLNSKTKKNTKNSADHPNNSATIYSDNILVFKKHEKLILSNKLSKDSTNNIDSIDTDNISCEKIGLNEHNKKHFLIDAVDLDKNLIIISPFITRGIKNTFIIKKYYVNKYFSEHCLPTKLSQIQKIKKYQLKTISKKYKIKKEVLMILLETTFKHNQHIMDDKIAHSFLSQRKFAPFFDRFMLRFGLFCYKNTFKHYPELDKSTILHNIYYRYISKSYKNVKSILKNNKIDVNFHNMDARSFVQQSTNKYNFIFLDAFTPAKSPALWTIQFFNKLYGLLEDDGVILTYSSSAAVRNALLLNGFCVGKTFDKSLNKFVGTIASKNPDLIEYALEQKDIDLINSKAGICYQDNDLVLDNDVIIKNRELEIEKSDLLSSSKVMKEHRDDNVKTL